jgi:hypothetical protein
MNTISSRIARHRVESWTTRFKHSLSKIMGTTASHQGRAQHACSPAHSCKCSYSFYFQRPPRSLLLRGQPEHMDQLFAYQPIDPSLRPLLDPEYVAFHEAFMQYEVPDEMKLWDGSARTQSFVPYGGSATVKVGRVVDVTLEHCTVRVFVPISKPGEKDTKHPALLWFHGGARTHLRGAQTTSRLTSNQTIGQKATCPAKMTSVPMSVRVSKMRQLRRRRTKPHADGGPSITMRSHHRELPTGP